MSAGGGGAQCGCSAPPALEAADGMAPCKHCMCVRECVRFITHPYSDSSHLPCNFSVCPQTYGMQQAAQERLDLQPLLCRGPALI